MKKRLLSILLTVCLLMGLLPTAALAAEGDVEYLYCDANGANWQTGTITAREYIVVESDITTWAGGWYVVNSNVDISSRVTVMGNVHLILTDGCTLTVNGGIQVTGGKALGGDSLTIYGQENGTGKLIATGTSYSAAGIGGRFDGNNGSGGTVTIHGGTVEATGGENSAGIGGGYGGSGGTVTIHGGTVEATGGENAAGIGGGYGGDGGTITINGGTVNATGGENAAGIGGGSRNLSGGSGGTITIHGGTVTATGGSGAEGAGAGIGGGRRGDGGTVTIAGGTVTATNDTDSDPGIGGGSGGGSGSFRTQGADGARGSAMIFAGSISDRSDEANWSGIIFPNWGVMLALPHIGTVYGEQTLPAELLIFGGYTLTIPAGASLTVPGGKTLSIRSDAKLINNGTLYCAGTTVINGTLTNNGTIYVDGNLNGTVSGDGVRYYLLTLTNCKVDETKTAAADTSTVNGKTFGKVGGTIYFTATPSANQLVTGWDVTKGVIKQETTDHSGCTISPMPADLVTVKANFATALTVTKPDDKTIDYGQTTTLSVTVSKHSALKELIRVYRWCLDGDPVTTTTEPSYTTPANLAAGDHTYTCTITCQATDRRFYTVTSAPATVTVNPLAETAPKISIDYQNETLTGFVSGSSYAINGTEVTPNGGKLSVVDYIGHNISIVTKASDSNHADSTAQTLTVPARPEPPSSSECTIDYINETISFDSSKYEVNTVADFTETAVECNRHVTPGTTLYVRKKAVAETSFASSATPVPIPERPAAPSPGAVDETVDGKHDAKITGLTPGTVYQISVDNGVTWQDRTADAAGKITGLAPKTYKVRVKATDTDFAGAAATVDIVIGAAKTYTLNVTAPTFAEAAYGYEQPAAQAITITSSGNWDSTITKVTVDSTDFTIGGSGGTVAAGGSIDSWTVQPAVGLAVGTHTATITVTYNDGASATAQISFTVTKAAQAAPAVPTLDGSTVTISEADRGKALEYSLNGGAWTDVPALDNGSFELPEQYENSGYTLALRQKASADGSYGASDAVGCFSVAYNANGGTGTVPCASASSDSAVTVAAGDQLQRTGYTFAGWNTEADGSGTAYAAGSAITTATTLFAQWTANSFGGSSGGSGGIPHPPVVEQPEEGGVTTTDKTKIFFVDISAGAYYETAVLWAAKNGITDGVSDTHFAPNAPCTRAQIVTFLWRAAGCPAPKSGGMPLTDVNESSYYYDAVLWAVENGITKGTGATTFSPNATCSREQIVSFLWRSQKSPASDSVNPFTDVAADAYYTDAVLWAVENGITKGTGATTFSPNDDCTRGQIVTFLWRALAE